MTDEPVKRRYDATARKAAAAATADRIRAAAETLFLRDGYARTSIRAVAKRAGVAEATVYLAFPNKPALLDAVIIHATRDNAGESFDAILAAPRHEILARFAASNAALMARAAPLIALGESAALLDADLRPLRERAHARLRAAFDLLADRLGTPEAATTLYALANETTYLRAGLAPDEYARWLTKILRSNVGWVPTVSVRYIVDDVDAAIAFYCERLGFTEVMHPAPAFAMLSLGDLRLVLSRPGGGPGGGAAMPDGELPTPGGWNRFQLEVPDLEATVEELKRHGVHFRSEIIAGVGGKQVVVDDPSGNPVELFEPTRPEAAL